MPWNECCTVHLFVVHVLVSLLVVGRQCVFRIQWDTRVDYTRGPIAGFGCTTTHLGSGRPCHHTSEGDESRGPPGHMVVMDTGLGRSLFAVGLHFLRCRSNSVIAYCVIAYCVIAYCDRLL